jgi:SAM-dependent methyltransferase
MARILRLATRVRREPVPYARAVSGLVTRFLASHGVTVEGTWLDVGSGGGGLTEALLRAGADRAIGLDVADRRLPDVRAGAFVLGSADRLPFADASFDGVVSSNVLEHVPNPHSAIEEMVRVCRQHGVIYVSWTNWLSPLGGHEWSPFHYLGPELGPRAYRIVRGRGPAWNVPGRTLFPLHVGPVLRYVADLDVEAIEVAPRYWPRLRWLARVPGLREVAMWNCALLLRRRSRSGTPSSGVSWRANASKRDIRRGASAGPRSQHADLHPEISWSIVLDAEPAGPIHPEEVGERVRAAWHLHDLPGAAPIPRVVSAGAGDLALTDAADRPYDDDGDLCRLIVADGPRPRLIVAGHHSAFDGLGLVALLGAALGVSLGTTARGTPATEGAPAGGWRYPLRRLEEALVHPPTRIAPLGGKTGAAGDHLLRQRSERTVSSAELIVAAASAVRLWNASADPDDGGFLDDRIVVAVGASRRRGADARIGTQAAWFRLAVPPDLDPDGVRRALATRGPEPSPAAGAARATSALGLGKVLARRTGSTMLVSNLGRVEPDGPLADAAFFPSAHGRSGVAIGGVGVGGRMTVTLRARRSAFSLPDAAALLDLVVERIRDRV